MRARTLLLLTLTTTCLSVAVGCSGHADNSSHTSTPAPPTAVATPTAPATTATPTESLDSRACNARQGRIYKLNERRSWLFCGSGSAGGTMVSKRLYTSGDSGQSWQLLAQVGFPSTLATPVDAYGDLPGPNINAVVFTSETDGWMATDEPGPTVWGTHDGGRTWIPAAIPSQARAFDIDCPDGMTCIVTGNKGIWLTEDAGEHWTLETFPCETGFPIMSSAIDAALQWTICFNGRAANTFVEKQIMRSVDRGETWELAAESAWARTPTPGIGQAPKHSISAMVFTSEVEGWIGEGGPGPVFLWHTSDGGRSWSPVAPERTPFPVRSIEAHDVEHIEVNTVGVWGTDDGGETWQLLATATSTLIPTPLPSPTYPVSAP